MLMLSFSISFVYLVVILLIFCVTPLWHAAAVHSPSGKALNSSSHEDPIFQGITSWHTNFTLSLHFISLWNSATAHSSSSKELKPSSLEEWCLSGLIALLMLSYYPACALGISLVWYSFILLIESKTAVFRNISFYVRSISDFCSERTLLYRAV